MAKMSEAQRTAVLGAHNYGGDWRYRGIVTACHNPTLDVLRREGWMDSEYRVTRAGLIAAGINMDKLRDKALADRIVRDDDPRDDAVRAEAVRWRMRGGRGDGLLWAADICREAAHREAAAECCEAAR